MHMGKFQFFQDEEFAHVHKMLNYSKEKLLFR